MSGRHGHEAALLNEAACQVQAACQGEQFALRPCLLCRPWSIYLQKRLLSMWSFLQSSSTPGIMTPFWKKLVNA